jgi:NTP pyrophosphatase (non-canonical NTP hydrolase)/BMFP domain-containing protein YqiC
MAQNTCGAGIFLLTFNGVADMDSDKVYVMVFRNGEILEKKFDSEDRVREYAKNSVGDIFAKIDVATMTNEEFEQRCEAQRTNAIQRLNKLDAYSRVAGMTTEMQVLIQNRDEIANLKEVIKQLQKGKFVQNLNEYAAEVHQANQKWWIDINTGKPITRNKAEMLCLIHSEVSEALEGTRKDLMDDHLPHRKMEEVEMADVIIRVFDYCAGHSLDLHGAFVEKMEYNARRADHTIEERLKANGKKF